MAKYLPLAALVILSCGVLFAQRNRTLVVNGKNVGVATVVIGGRTYVDVTVLANALNGSVTLQPDRVVLTLPNAPGGDGDISQDDGPRETISKEFASAALATMGLMREWKGAIETMIGLQLPVTGTYFQDLQYRAEEGLRQTSLLASTDQDHQANQVLQSGYSLLAKWAGNAIATRQALNATRTVSPDVLKNDQDLQKINVCGRSLGNMLVSLQFAEIPSCH